MRIYQRIKATLNSTIEHAVSQIEDHEAVVEVSLKEMRTAVAKARIRLARVAKDNTALQEKIAQLEATETSWANRALQVAKTDKEQALQCIERRNTCAKQLEQSRNDLAANRQFEENISRSVADMEQKLQVLIQHHHQMRSRHSTADAMRVVRAVEHHPSALGLEAAFERWEAKIMEAEYDLAPIHTDSLDAQFSAKEAQEKLEADLRLLQQSHSAGNKE